MGRTIQRRRIVKYVEDSWTLSSSLAPAPGMEYQSTIMRTVSCGVHSTKKSTLNKLPRRTCSWRRAETILWGCQGRKRWKLDERTIGFAFGQHFGEIDVGFPNLSGIPRVIGEASNLHELSARDTGRTLGGLWW